MSPGSVSSPRYPNYPYPNAITCNWTITVAPDKFIRLEFSAFEVEFICDSSCVCSDKLELWDGPEGNETKVARYEDSSKIQQGIKHNSLQLSFSSLLAYKL